MAEPQSFEVPAFFPKSYQSDTRYHFEEYHADAIICVATHQERYYQHQATTRFKANEQKAITSSIATPFTPSSTADNGTLDCLPLSLLQDIVLLCDMSSVFKLRQASRRSRAKVDSVWQYQRLVKHALDLFRASLTSNVACKISLADCYKLLITRSCGFCGYDALYVNLPTWKRVCRGCLKDAPEVHYLDKSILKSKIKVTKEEMAQLTVFKTPPELVMNRYINLNTELVSVLQAKKMLGSPRDRYIEETFGKQNSEIKRTTCAMPLLDKQGKSLNYWVSCEGCKQGRHTIHEMNKEVKEEYLMQQAIQWRVYDRDGFLEHFRWCKEAQVIWEEQREKMKGEK
jgi:hypothetical protein